MGLLPRLLLECGLCMTSGTDASRRPLEKLVFGVCQKMFTNMGDCRY